MSAYIALLFNWGPEETGRISSLLHLAETASAMNMETRVFLFEEGAVLARAGTLEKVDSEVSKRFGFLLQNGHVKMYVCEDAARKRAIHKGNMETGVSMIGYATFLGMAIEAQTVITI